MTSLSWSQGDVLLDILDTDETPVTQSCLGDSCVLEIALGDSLYGDDNNDMTSATIMGVAALEHKGRRQLATVRAEMDFSAEITLEAATTDIVGDVNGNEGNPGDNVTDNNGTVSRKVAWLFPLLAVLFVAFVCILVVVRKRREQQRTSRAGSRTSSV